MEFPAPKEGARGSEADEAPPSITARTGLARAMTRAQTRTRRSKEPPTCLRFNLPVCAAAGFRDMVTPLAHKQQFFPDEFLNNVLKVRGRPVARQARRCPSPFPAQTRRVTW